MNAANAGLPGVDISQGHRDFVDLHAEAVGSLGEHLKQIGDIIADSTQPPRVGAPRTTAAKVRDKLELYKEYCVEVQKRREEIEKKREEDLRRLVAWRKECGTEGANLVEELEALYDKVRTQKHMIEERDTTIEQQIEEIEGLNETIERKRQKLAYLASFYAEKKELFRADRALRAGVSSWLQCTVDNIKFKFQADQEWEKLRIEHQQRLRKAACERRLKGIRTQREANLLQKCFLAMQEETIEGRGNRHLNEIRRRYEDHVLVLQGQFAQAMGDEEKAKTLVAEQVRRIEEEKKKAKESERLMREAQKDARAARQERDRMAALRDQAIADRDEARRLQKIAEDESAQAKKDAAFAKDRMEEYKEMMLKSQDVQRELEELLRKKNKKIKSLQRMLVELGAESDSDAPPDERPPAFFVNEDGTKAPRPRTRKERMAMAYREAESARWELRLGMAAMVDKEVGHKAVVDRLREDLDIASREISNVRGANEVLHADVEAAVAAANAVQTIGPCPTCGAGRGGFRLEDRRPATAGAEIVDLTHAPLPEPPLVPLAPSRSAVPPWSPAMPNLAPPKPGSAGQGSATSVATPQALVKSASQPIVMPPLTTQPAAAAPDRLAP
eukprot:CAMPEP_0206421178 /NCGR_PEP_ID=MMETSP0324_2-20121206/1295_1 /ASSEMBLY_ACC=CAM_ASM_000836 /TAXON_ID=2866 /ORGANISM="Crypthecodinium cohnii, Strain Seligo" /LENGTH=615 /DNA_ID=CAMNT_0053885227 /DNA_START=224 /DNA_END=2068 /DNA_ORIENTATION=-